MLSVVAGGVHARAAESVVGARLPALSWRMIGPFRGGRVSAVAGVPNAPFTFYMAPDNGGVWKTTDAGRSWQPLFDAQPTQSIGALAVAPSDPRVVYAGSGEGLQRPDLSVGDGLYASRDGGTTWTHLGLRSGQQIAKIAIDSRDARRLYVAVLGHPYGPNAERGIYRSTDGGATFAHVLDRGPDAGAFDVAIAPGDGRTLYATLWSARWPPWMAFGSLQRRATGSGIFKSTDGGTTWAQSTRGLPGDADGIGRCEIAVAPNDPARVYAAVDARTGGGIFRSDDAGATWRRTNGEDRITQRGDDLASLAVDPHDRDVVWFTNTTTYRSRDGGSTFDAVKGAPGGDDYHAVWIAPGDSNVVALGSDQGATISLNGGATWSSWYNQPTAQMFHVTADDRFPYWVYGGQQESGSVGIASRGNDGAITFRDWHPVGAEEYGYVAPDPLHPSVVFGGKGQKFDFVTGQVRDVSPVLTRGEYRYDRTAPLIFSHVDPHLLFLGANVVFATRDGGATWQTISPDLTRAAPGVPPNLTAFAADDPALGKHRGVIYALAPSYRNARVLWAGTNDGSLWRTHDGGATWQNVTPPSLGAWSKVTQIDAARYDDETAYASVSRFLLDDLAPYVYRTHDGGRTWQSIGRGLPPDAPVNAVRADPVRRGLLYAATERGVDVSFDDGDSWQPLQANLPATSVRDLIVHGNDLAIATHGRSFYIMDDVAALRELDPAARPVAPRLYTPAAAVRVRRDTNSDTPLPPEESVGQNPPDGAIFDYELARPARVVALEITAANGRIVRRYASDDLAPVDPPLAIPSYWVRPFDRLATGAGMHRFVWDLHATPPSVAEYEYPIAAIYRDTPREPLGPLVPPGTYRVTLVVDGARRADWLAVGADPRVDASAADYARQYDVATRIVELTNACAAASTRVAEIRAHSKTSAGADSAERTVADDLASLSAPDTGLAGVVAPLAELLASIESSDASPTAAQSAAFASVSASAGRALGVWERLRDRDLPALRAAHPSPP